MRLDPGAVVAERYRIKGGLGRGGVATVYRATDVKFEADVALKVATVTGHAYDEFKARFQREARIGHLLGKSEGLVRALDWGELAQGETLYMALDLVEGARVLDPTKGTRAERLQLLASAAELVATVHRQGVVHRDVKPANFLIDAGGQLHLADFGEARSMRHRGREEPSSEKFLTRTGASVGTPLFMAPEQYEDARNADERADVYSLGVMLYLALTGKYPYDGPSTIQIMVAQMQAREGRAPRAVGPRKLDASVSPELDRLCLSAITLEAADRLGSAETLARELRRLATSTSEPARPPRKAAPSRSSSEVRGVLRVDGDGFATRADLKRVVGLVDLLGDTPVLAVRDERPVEGHTEYANRVAFLLPRGASASGEVTLGRNEKSDVCVRLVTMSTDHARFRRIGDGSWTIEDLGSRNGTFVNGERLAQGEEREVGPGDRINFSKHITLEVLLPAALEAEL